MAHFASWVTVYFPYDAYTEGTYGVKMNQKKKVEKNIKKVNLVSTEYCETITMTESQNTLAPQKVKQV